MFDRSEIENLIDGIGSPSERKSNGRGRGCADVPKPEPAPTSIAGASMTQLVIRVLNRFPHLTVDEAIAFARAVQANDGSILTHSGVFAPTRRRWSTTSRRLAGQFDFYCSWTCCNSIVAHDATPTCVPSVRCRKSEMPTDGVYDAMENSVHTCETLPCTRPDLHKSAPDLKNRDPVGRCDSATMFHLISARAKANSI